MSENHQDMLSLHKVLQFPSKEVPEIASNVRSFAGKELERQQKGIDTRKVASQGDPLHLHTKKSFLHPISSEDSDMTIKDATNPQDGNHTIIRNKFHWNEDASTRYPAQIMTEEEAREHADPYQ